jgi:pyruvate dehydrogenase complex dehydrogenase (E1) component
VGDHGYWFLALALGLVVTVVAVILLEVFLREVHRIEQGAASVWTAGKQVARNTSTTWLLGATSDRLTVLTEEAGRHADLLSPRASAPQHRFGPGGSA